MDITSSELELDPIRTPSVATAPPVPSDGVLAFIDSTAGGINAAWRAALVARDHGRPLHLVSIQSHASDAAAAKALLQELALQLETRIQVRASTTAVTSEMRECVTALAAGKDLVVVPRQPSESWADKVLGTLPERMLRWLSIPLLVVRRPANASYRRVLASVKLDADAERQIGAARFMARGQALRVFHVLEPGAEGSLRLAVVSDLTVSLHRQRRLERAHLEIEALIDRAGARGSGASGLIAFGHVSRRVLDAARGHNAQLIVIGSGRRSAFGDVFFGGLVQDLIREAEADLLVLPQRQGEA